LRFVLPLAGQNESVAILLHARTATEANEQKRQVGTSRDGYQGGGVRVRAIQMPKNNNIAGK
jgi:hypothetical protein